MNYADWVEISIIAATAVLSALLSILSISAYNKTRLRKNGICSYGIFSVYNLFTKPIL
jgi:hypothetical protein